MTSPAWYHQHITRKLITAFLAQFNDITVEKYAWDETTQDYIPRSIYQIPIHFASGDKMWLINQSTSARKTFPPENALAPVEMHMTVPRIGVSLSGLVYDTDRHNNKNNRVTVNGGANSIYMPVPYNVELEMTSITKSIDDSFQIMEQILPYFSPAISLDINTYLDIVESIPVTLNSMTLDFPTDVAETDDRLFQVSYFFTMRANYYMQKKDRKVIEHAIANLGNTEVRVDAV